MTTNLEKYNDIMPRFSRAVQTLCNNWKGTNQIISKMSIEQLYKKVLNDFDLEAIEEIFKENNNNSTSEYLRGLVNMIRYILFDYLSYEFMVEQGDMITDVQKELNYGICKYWTIEEVTEVLEGLFFEVSEPIYSWNDTDNAGELSFKISYGEKFIKNIQLYYSISSNKAQYKQGDIDFEDNSAEISVTSTELYGDDIQVNLTIGLTFPNSLFNDEASDINSLYMWTKEYVVSGLYMPNFTIDLMDSVGPDYRLRLINFPSQKNIKYIVIEMDQTEWELTDEGYLQSVNNKTYCDTINAGKYFYFNTTDPEVYFTQSLTFYFDDNTSKTYQINTSVSM